MSLPAQHDQDLLFRIARGDQEAFTRLFEQYHHRLGAFVFGITRSKEQAEEIVLDVFLKIWMTREVLGEVNNFPSYLFLVARNASISALRKTIRERNLKANLHNQSVEDAGQESILKWTGKNLLDVFCIEITLLFFQANFVWTILEEVLT